MQQIGQQGYQKSLKKEIEQFLVFNFGVKYKKDYGRLETQEEKDKEREKEMEKEKEKDYSWARSDSEFYQNEDLREY